MQFILTIKHFVNMEIKSADMLKNIENNLIKMLQL